MPKKISSLIVIICFFLTTLGPLPKAHADPVLDLPTPGSMVNLSPVYEPVIIKGLTVHKDDPFLFDFIVDVGQDKMSGEPLKKEGEKLIKYFLASLAVPDKDVWVNLSPYEKNKMIPEALGQTDMGRDLLEQDYILKQLTASLIYPEKQLGKTFWNRVYAQAQEMYGTTRIPVNTFNKVWIMADRAEVFEHDQTAFVVDSHMKVMLEEDYLALRHHSQIKSHTIASQVVRQIILPEIEKEVNTGKNFAHLRQILNSLILANWYKNNLKQALLNQVYTNQGKVKGINLNDPTVKQQIYEQYLKAYKKGVFNYIKEDVTIQGDLIPRKYFSGGFDEAMAVKDPMVTEDPAKLGNLPNEVMVTMTTGLLSFKNPDAAMTTSDKVRAIIAQTLGLEFNEVTPESHFTDWAQNDMYMDNRINVALQNGFKIDIPFDFILNEWTVGRMITYIQEHIDLLPSNLRAGQIQLKMTDKDNLIEGNLEDFIKTGELNENTIIKDFTYRIEMTDREKIIGQLGGMYGKPSAIYFNRRVVTAEEANDLLKGSDSVRAYHFDPDKIGKFLLGARPPYLRDEFKEIMKALSTQMIIFTGESMNHPDAAMESITDRVKKVIADVTRYQGSAAEIGRNDSLETWGVGPSNKKYLIRMIETEFNEFHIVITYNDAVKMNTVGDIITFILAAVNGADSAMTGGLGLTLGQLREALKADEILQTPHSPEAYFNGQPLSLDNSSSDIPLSSRVAMALIAKVGTGTDNKFYYSIDNHRTDRTVINIIKFTEPYNTAVNIGGLVIGGAIAYFPYSRLSEYLSAVHSLSPNTINLTSFLVGVSSAVIITLFYREVLHWSESRRNAQSSDAAMLSAEEQEFLRPIQGLQNLRGNVAVLRTLIGELKDMGINPKNTVMQVIDESDRDRLLQEEVIENPKNFRKLANGKDYVAFSHVDDTARSEDATFVATDDENGKGRDNNHKMADAEEQKARAVLKEAYTHEKKLYIVPMVMGQIGSELMRVIIQVTENRYGVVNTIGMAGVGRIAIDQLSKMKDPNDFVVCFHDTGDLNAIHQNKKQGVDNRFFGIFLRKNKPTRVYLYGSGYGGNLLVGKKFIALREAMARSIKDKWVALHGYILEIKDLQGDHTGRLRYVIGQYPSGSGKTSTSAAEPPKGSRLEKMIGTATIGDDIAWVQARKDGLYAQNPEYGMFIVLPGTGWDDTPRIMKMLDGPQPVIYTNPGYNPKTGEVFWEGIRKGYYPSLEGDGQYWQDWKGNLIVNRDVSVQIAEQEKILGRQLNSDEILLLKSKAGEWAQKNSRATIPIANGVATGVVSREVYNPQGVRVNAILTGARSQDNPLTRIFSSYKEGLYSATTMIVQPNVSMAENLQAGATRNDPFALKPFMSSPETEFIRNFGEVVKSVGSHAPVFADVNSFRIDPATGKPIFMGYGYNLAYILADLDFNPQDSDYEKTPIGFTPKASALLHRWGLEGAISEAKLQETLTFDLAKQRQIVESHTGILKSLEVGNNRLPAFIWEANEELRKNLGLKDLAMAAKKYGAAKDFADLLLEDIDHGSYDWQRGSYQGYNSQTILIGEMSLKSRDIVIDDTAIGQNVKSLRTGDEVKTSAAIAHVFNFSDGRVVVFSGLGRKTSLTVDAAMAAKKKIFDLGEKPLSNGEKVEIKLSKLATFYLGTGDSRPYYEISTSGENGAVELALVFQGQEQTGWQFLGYVGQGIENPETPGLKINLTNGKVFVEKESTNSGEVHYKIDEFSNKSSPVQAPEADKAALAQKPGGIDLNTSNGMQWKVSKDGNGVEMNIDPAMIERIKREGIDSLSPVIYKITPVTSIWPLVGLQVPTPAEHLAGL